MKLWVARHAQPLVAAGVCYGALDVAADVQATQAAAEKLAAALPLGIAVTSSPLQRCEQLAQSLRSLRPDLTPIFDARLREMDFGQWEGQRWDAIGHSALEAWTADFAWHRPGGGESVQLFMQRVAAAWDAVGTQPRLWITHAGVARACSLLAVGMRDIQQANQWPHAAPGYGEWFIFEAGVPVQTPPVQPGC